MVIDETALDGRYDFTLRWTPAPAAAADASSADRGADSGPSIFTALEEQLGLTLVATKRSVRVIVIDHIERPTAN